jgi:hypothetical protein
MIAREPFYAWGKHPETRLPSPCVNVNGRQCPWLVTRPPTENWFVEVSVDGVEETEPSERPGCFYFHRITSTCFCALGGNS